jgi:uncharacterized repeat protein (TIGR03803 family)
LGGGADSLGVVFKLTSNSDGSWTEQVLYSFTGGADGDTPAAGLIFDIAGNLYGTAEFGGNLSDCNTRGCGVVFKLTPNSNGKWSESVLHAFTGFFDGGVPSAHLIFDKTGNLYGTTRYGGAGVICGNRLFGCGVVFKVAPNSDGSWTESVLHRFANDPAEYPDVLIFDAAGSLYGTAFGGGPADGGAVFKLAPNADGSWAYSMLHVFLGKPALTPEGGVVLDKAGNLYGTTGSCGSRKVCTGVVYEITP